MHIASIKGNYKIVKLLLLYGANPFIRTYKSNYSPYDYAAESNQVKVVKLLKPFMDKENINKDEFEDGRGFKSTKHTESPLNRLKQNVDLNYNISNFNSNNTSKNCRNDNFHERTKSSQNYNHIQLNDNNHQRITSNFVGTKDNFSLSFMNQVTIFEEKIEKIKNDLANININDNFKTSASKDNNINSMNSTDLYKKNFQSNNIQKNITMNNIDNSYNQNDYFSNFASPVNVDLSKELKAVLNYHKKNTISVDNSLYNSIENLYSYNGSNYTSNFKENLINTKKQAQNKNSNNNYNPSNLKQNYLNNDNNSLINTVQKPSNHSTLKKSEKNGNNYTLNVNESRVITLKPEELGESYEKPINNNNNEESRITYNNINAEEIFNLPLQQRNYLTQNTKISDQFWNDIESGRGTKKIKQINKLRISENFYDNQKILAIFSSSRNDIRSVEEDMKYNHDCSSKSQHLNEFDLFNNNSSNRQLYTNLNYNNKIVALNKSDDNDYSENNLTSKRDLKFFAKNLDVNKEKNITSDLKQTINDDITYKKVFNYF